MTDLLPQDLEQTKDLRLQHFIRIPGDLAVSKGSVAVYDPSRQRSSEVTL